ncbi:uncharacterized protein [Ptychodera flava]|uniref:uncharacterized protein n=1 Tax=Ptychodera flava TaxID=63121 RepID=UPI00396A7622
MWPDPILLFTVLLFLSAQNERLWSASANDDVGNDDDAELMPSAANPPSLDHMPPLYGGSENGDRTGEDVPPPGGGLNNDGTTTSRMETEGVPSTPGGKTNTTSSNSGQGTLQVEDNDGDKSGGLSPTSARFSSLLSILFICTMLPRLL